MTIPVLDHLAAYRDIKPEIDQAMSRSAAAGWHVGGPDVAEFESEFAAYLAVKDCLAFASGRIALVMALRAVGVKHGDEVILPANAMRASWDAVHECGAVAVPVDPQCDTAQIDPALIEAVVTPRTKTILVSHLYGIPADMDAVLAVARRRGLKVVEDASHALGACYKGRRIGAHGDAVAWGFSNLGRFGSDDCAGAVTTDNRLVALRLRILRDCESDSGCGRAGKGRSASIDPVTAAVLRVKLLHLDAWNRQRCLVAAYYQQRIDRSALTLPVVPALSSSSWHMFVVRHARRDSLRTALAAAGIQTAIPHEQPHGADSAEACAAGPNASALSARMASQSISLPMGAHLTAEQIHFVVSILNSLAAHE
ncbi:DegT/DnrJ/EryC1/StrS family aminotransferase [Noviherbaspirillum pedocola]|uniref:DegT/DnrJ/EryC1/StrS family aminotransferase n=1 Tax=Noviherbaspirillum pedocola TaxID=2801341 RepID=A0A934W243_9BURK|nr:DegT/DnrJ/EryC1/StrS family aminotransferase [Noviherbaspirillum pedocola]MBK4735896.1 DegT/DnrJ/EryC1/StrS family aminotransferase [Noviherbaspirillum pedocola]